MSWGAWSRSHHGPPGKHLVYKLQPLVLDSGSKTLLDYSQTVDWAPIHLNESRILAKVGSNEAGGLRVQTMGDGLDSPTLSSRRRGCRWQLHCQGPCPSHPLFLLPTPSPFTDSNSKARDADTKGKKPSAFSPLYSRFWDLWASPFRHTSPHPQIRPLALDSEDVDDLDSSAPGHCLN